MNITLSKFTIIALLLVCGRMTGQDTETNHVNHLNYKIQLLETQLKLLGAKQELQEINPQQQIDSKLQEIDSILKVVRTEQANKKSAVTVNTKYDTIIIYKNDSDTTAIKPFISAFKINPIRVFEGTLQISYERALKENLSVDVSVMGTYVSKYGLGNNYINSQDFFLYEKATDTYSSYNGDVIKGFGIVLEARNYLLPRIGSHIKAPLGLYAAPQLMYRNSNIIGYQEVYIDSTWQEQKVKQNLNVFAMSAVLGGKFAISKIICVDVWVGGALRFSKYSDEKELTRNKRWVNIDYTGVLPTIGITIGILK